MNLFILTFGCQMNKSDSERIFSLFKKQNYHLTSSLEKADFIVVNMCSVRQSAVDRVYALEKKIKELKKKKETKTLLTGCFLKSDFEKFKNFFDYILPIKELKKWPLYLKEKNFYKFSSSEKETTDYLQIPPNLLFSPVGYVPISKGCDNFCTYCVVPYTRGRLVCRDHLKIVKEAQSLIKKGIKEIWLLGQNVNQYQSPTDKNINFEKLLRLINNLQGDFLLRFASPHPAYFTNSLILTLAKLKKYGPYLNLPVQSGDDQILKKMNRPYTVKDYLQLIKKIKNAFKKYRKGLEKEISLSTDIIVGFPGETRKNFENTLKLIKKVKFDSVYSAKYSPRPFTKAFSLKEKISSLEKERRYKKLNKLVAKIALEKNKKFYNKKIIVLPLEEKKDFLIGRSFHNKTVKFKGDKNLIGKFVIVQIRKIFPWGLEGFLID